MQDLKVTIVETVYLYDTEKLILRREKNLTILLGMAQYQNHEVLKTKDNCLVT